MTLNPWKPEEYFVVFEDDSVKWSLPKSWTPYVNEVAQKHHAHQQQVQGQAIMAMSTKALESSVQALSISQKAVATSATALSSSQAVTSTTKTTRVSKTEERKQILNVIAESVKVSNGLVQLGTAAAGCASM
jgi:hypothetical protein